MCSIQVCRDLSCSIFVTILLKNVASSIFIALVYTSQPIIGVPVTALLFQVRDILIKKSVECDSMLSIQITFSSICSQAEN